MVVFYLIPLLPLLAAGRLNAMFARVMPKITREPKGGDAHSRYVLVLNCQPQFTLNKKGEV